MAGFSIKLHRCNVMQYFNNKNTVNLREEQPNVHVVDVCIFFKKSCNTYTLYGSLLYSILTIHGAF